ncbi:MAG TPA: tetratricopeptide repeat protein [Anaerolineales bacterium]|nr:tetratricopeptide repeat protein [Anaerolineales bacterium]
MAKVSLRAYNREIETLIDSGQIDEATVHCRHILKTYPKHLETYRLLGKSLLEAKRYSDAVDIFSRILASVPNDFVSHVGMSIIRDEENNLDEAIWHMERAFETQPSNAAIQGELQRLYARRDGVRPPRIRMTRGALANMYVQGELYPQAISEIRNVLTEDAERADMQALLARACYKSGLKNEAADVASALLKRYPYSLDANRVLIEILGSEHPESTQQYLQRVFELDPYTAHVTGDIFLASEVSDAAVNIERLEWDGQPAAAPSDWEEPKGTNQESEEEQPVWLSKPVDETSVFGASAVAAASIFGSTQSEPPAETVESAPVSVFGSAALSESPSAQSDDDIPEFMRSAGWGKSRGQFDESKSAFGAEETQPDETIEQGELPDWIKAMKPAEAEPPQQVSDEELPDWITAIGVGALASRLVDKSEQPSEEPAVESVEQTAWLGQMSGDSGSTPAADSTDELDWLKKLAETDTAPAAPQTDELDWMKELGSTETPPFTDQTAGEEIPDWLQGAAETPVESAEMQTEELSWLKDAGLSDEAAPSPEKDEENDWLKSLGRSESTPSAESEDQPDWLKGLAVAGGVAAASYLAKDDEPAETTASSATPIPSTTDDDYLHQLTEEPILQTPPESTPSTTDLDNLGVSEQERDDSFAWLESLAAKQGATEGLLTTPEERSEEEPDWVKQAKGLKSETPVSEAQREQPPIALEDLGKSEQEQDDSFAWLESLAVRQGASEGLLTEPEERLQEEPEWVRQAKDLSTAETPSAVLPEPEQEESSGLDLLEHPAAIAATAAWLGNLGDEEKESEPVTAQAESQAEQPAEMDEVDSWLKNLEGVEKPSEPAADETAVWLKGLDESETASVQAVEPTDESIPEWMKDIEVAPEEKAAVIFAEETEPASTWMPPAEEAALSSESKPEEESLPDWLSELDEEEEQIAAPADAEDLPAWLRADESAPAITEPTIFSDWKPEEEAQEVSASMKVEQPQAAQAEPEPAPVMELPQATPEPQAEPAPPPSSGLVIPTTDPVLGMARDELSGNNIEGALASYGKLIKKGRYLDEVIYDLRDALYRHPVDINIWQSLGDAYMRSSRLQDALDAYTKAEELLR